MEPSLMTEGALTFLDALHKKFNLKRKDMLKMREEKKLSLKNGGKLGFLDSTKEIRDMKFTCAPIPKRFTRQKG